MSINQPFRGSTTQFVKENKHGIANRKFRFYVGSTNGVREYEEIDVSSYIIATSIGNRRRFKDARKPAKPLQKSVIKKIKNKRVKVNQLPPKAVDELVWGETAKYIGKSVRGTKTILRNLIKDEDLTKQERYNLLNTKIEELRTEFINKKGTLVKKHHNRIGTINVSKKELQDTLIENKIQSSYSGKSGILYINCTEEQYKQLIPIPTNKFPFKLEFQS
jgi:hypothetical protein